MHDGGNILEERKTLNDKKLMDAKLSAAQLMELENKHGAHNYHCLLYTSMPREDTGKEDFFEFYERFANDSVFQLSRLHEPLKFVTADPEDEFQIDVYKRQVLILLLRMCSGTPKRFIDFG